MSSSKDHPSSSVQPRATTYVFPIPDPLHSESEPEAQLSVSTGLSAGTSSECGQERKSISGSAMTKEFGTGGNGASSCTPGAVPPVTPNVTVARKNSTSKLGKAPLLKTSSLGLGTSAFGSEGEKHRLQSTFTPQQPTSSVVGSSLSNISSFNPATKDTVGGHRVSVSSSASTSGCSTSVVGTSNSGHVSGASVGQVKLPQKSALKGHIRSASHGGVIQPMRNYDASSGMETKSSVLKKGHTRAASHGQIVEDPPQGLKTHNRAPSKTEFILPPGHRERERLNSTGVQKESHWRGHSRQASRSESIYTLRQHKTPMKNKIFFWKRTDTDNPKVRKVVPNHTVTSDISKDQHPNGNYPSNRITTTKYTTISFLPKNLFEQFHRFANLYFISIVLLNWIPAINAFGKEIAMLPVMFVLGVTAIKDLFEDRRRYNSDKRINNSTCKVWNSTEKKLMPIKWKDIRVGDFVHLSCDDVIPADILLLRTSDQDGLCYVETTNLDGESNLKQMKVVRGFAERQNRFDVSKFVSPIEVRLPTTKIDRFDGKMIHPNTEQVPLTKENLLLRDCRLKNTDFVEGIVVYAGKETKAMLNNGGPRHKRTGLERLMNLEVVWCVVILAVLCIVGATGSGLWVSSFHDVPFYPKTNDDPDLDVISKVFLSFLTYIIILQVMIPLSLYVTIELTKLMQIYHIQNDLELFDPDTNKRIECRAMNIPEDLGQIQYVFSDKTGTLTENSMVFRRCSIGAVDYNHAESAEMAFNPQSVKKNPSLAELLEQINIQLSLESGNTENGRIREFFLILAICNTVVVARHPHVDRMSESGVLEDSDNQSQTIRLSPIRESVDSSSLASNSFISHDRSTSILIDYQQDSSGSFELPPEPLAPNFISSNDKLPAKSLQAKLGRRPKILDVGRHGRPLSPISSSNETTPTESPAQRQRSFPFLPKFSKTLAVTNLPPQTPSPSEPKPIFEAESPDELALVNAAFVYNCKLVRRSPTSVTVSMPGESPIEYEVLHVFDFDSVRKRMSIVVRHPHTNQVILYCKGADSAVFSKLRRPVDAEEEELANRTQVDIDNYAREGLRTLVMARRLLSEREYNSWLSKFKQAELDMDNRDRLIADSFNQLEFNLELIGATGIEDRLQDRVPETIEALRKAGIVVWVLTGDKRETAVSIAKACKLFSPNMDIIPLYARSKDSTERLLHYYLEQVEQFKDGANPSGRQGTSEGQENTFNAKTHRGSGICAPLVSKERALVVDGTTLTYILDQKTQLLTKFLSLTKHCSSVLCCRATPLQKAFIVSSVKDQLGMRTLAIGDGANDVSMIQRADVGIGISGKEGMQAVMASDFAISKFKYLERLLLVHGHWCYDRLARMILYFFYKNAAFVFVIFWYQLLNGWSGSVMIDQMYLMVFNLFFTALPPMAIGIYDQDCPADLLLACPKLYRQGRLQKVHQAHSFWLNMLDALYQSVVIFFMAYGAYSGSDIGMLEFGTTITVSCMFTMLSHMAIEAKSWTIIHVLSIVVSVLLFYGFAFVYNTICINCLGFENPFWVIHELIVSPVHWLIVFVTTVLAVLPRLIIRCLENSLFPSDVTRALLARQQSSRRDEEVYVSWSRSTSSSSIFKDRISWLCFSKRRGGVGEARNTAVPSISTVAT